MLLFDFLIIFPPSFVHLFTFFFAVSSMYICTSMHYNFGQCAIVHNQYNILECAGSD